MTITREENAEKKMIAFFVGENGESNYQAISALNENDAKEIWKEEFGREDSETEVCAFRVQAWDNKKAVFNSDILNAGFETICDKCGYETSKQSGGDVCNDMVLCEDCQEPKGENDV